jgi:hypothetical protein
MLVPPKGASIVFAHTPGGVVPPGYWWVEGRLSRPGDASFSLMPALRVVYVPVGLAYVAYDAAIAGKAVRGVDLRTVDTIEFSERTGRVADRTERVELGRRLALVSAARDTVARLLAHGMHADAFDAIESASPGTFQKESKPRPESMARRILGRLSLDSYVNAIVVFGALAVLAVRKGGNVTNVLMKVFACTKAALKPTSARYYATLAKLGARGLDFVSPMVAGVMLNNRTLSCAVVLALSVLAVVQPIGMWQAASIFVATATADMTIGCIGDMAELLHMRSAGELIAAVALIAAHISETPNAAVVLSADALERLVASRFNVAVPRSLVGALLAAASAAISARSGEDVLVSYLTKMSGLDSRWHRLALCLVEKK